MVARRTTPGDQPTFSMVACRIRNLPASWIWLNAASLSSAQLPDGSVTLTVMLLLLSRLVTLSVVPIGNVPLDAAGAPASPESVTVSPLHTTCPDPAFPAGFVVGAAAAGGAAAGGAAAAAPDGAAPGHPGALRGTVV